MMIKPGISELSKCVDSRYTLVTMAAKRARMIGEARMEENEAFGDEKPVSVAAEEIVSGKVGYVRSEAIERAKAWEDEKAAAILSMSTADSAEEMESDNQPEEDAE
ncbi:MAG: DNA-directed RNA polymerase subunit omega [Hominilimicola sp.]